MYAVISTGGKQYRLKEGDLVAVESLNGAVGDQVVFGEVLALGDQDSATIGTPLIEGAQVVGTIVEQGRGKKVKILKFKRRKMHRKRSGHRQGFTSVKIDSIETGGKSEEKVARKQPRKAESDAKTPETKKSEAAPKKRKPAAKETKKAAKRAAGTKKVEKKGAAKKAEE